MTLIRLIFAVVPRWLWLALCVVLVAVALFWAGRVSETRDRALQDAQDAVQTHERIDDADLGTGDAVDDNEWLRNRGQR